VGRLILGLIAAGLMGSLLAGCRNDPIQNAPQMSPDEEKGLRQETMSEDERKMLENRPR